MIKGLEGQIVQTRELHARSTALICETINKSAGGKGGLISMVFDFFGVPHEKEGVIAEMTPERINKLLAARKAFMDSKRKLKDG